MERLEQLLFRSAGALVVDPRVMRRIIKAHRGASGLVPHARCYAVYRGELMSTGLVSELGVRFDDLPDPVLLVARPSSRETQGSTDAQILARLWRLVFHARIHVALESKVRAGELDTAALRVRIDRIGQIEFDEVRAILRHDDLVLPPYDDREVYIEFAALYLEQRYFAPGLLVTTFPGISHYDELDAMFAADIDVGPLLDNGRPNEIERPTALPIGGTTATHSTHAAFALAEAVTLEPVSPRKAQKLLAEANAARAAGNDVRAALCAARAASVEDQAMRAQAESATRDALTNLGKRLGTALRPPEAEGRPPGRPDPSWSSLLVIVGDRAAAERATRYSIEARLLYTLQLAALAHERPESIVDVPGFLSSFGKRKAVRSLPATRELRIARYLAEAAKLVRHTRVAGADRKLLAKLLDWANDRAEQNVRAAMRPKIYAMLDRIGMVAKSDPERLARDKLVEELLDTILEHGFLTFGQLRDAISRNQLKLRDLGGVRELWGGDPLLLADRALAEDLDGVYHPSDVYLRGLQKASSVPFGTRVGRFLTLYFVLPLGAAWVLLTAVSHLFHMVVGKLGFHKLAATQLLTIPSFAITAVIVFALIHSLFFRRAALQAVELLGMLLGLLFIRLPRALFTRPSVRRWMALPKVRLVMRRVLFPAIVGAAVWYLAPWRVLDRWLGIAIGLGAFIATSLVLGTRIGAMVEDFVFEQLAPTWQVVSGQLLPGLLRMIGRFFARVMDLLQRAMVRVDEALRFREGQSRAWIVIKGGLGVVWSMVAYLVRLYVSLLIEPYVNPIKHFPVVLVAHKMMAPYFFTVLAQCEKLLKPALGSIAGGTLAYVTAFFLPTVFGFFAWELKENYKLYGATRREQLEPALIGHHGETMRGLLVVGMHSGTLPKLYERLRRAAQREDEAALIRGSSAKGSSSSLGTFREGLHEVEQSVRRFVDRELSKLLSGAARWPFGELTIEGIELSSNRIRIRLSCHALSQRDCEITIEEQSGMIVAGFVEGGFVHDLALRSPEATVLFENALAGLYQRAEVDLVREQIEAELGPAVAYDIADGALVVWPGEDYRTELVYRLGKSGQTVAPEVSGAPSTMPVRVLDTRNIFFRDQAIGWLAWVSAWSAAAHPEAPIPRLLRGTSILPQAHGRTLPTHVSEPEAAVAPV
jgi:hypothetical protein